MKRILSVVVLGVLMVPAIFSGVLAAEATEGNWGLKREGDSFVCTESVDSSAKLTWAGRCTGGVPTGEGVVGIADWYEASGAYVDGKRNGRWVTRTHDGICLYTDYSRGREVRRGDC